MTPSLVEALSRPRSHAVFYGTSLTKSGGWAETVSRELARRFPEVWFTNAACNGRHSRWGLEQFEARVLSQLPDVLFIEFAINDAVARFALSPDESRRNLEAMLDRLAERRPECAVVVQVMNPVIDRPAGHDGHRPGLSRYEQVSREVAHARGLTLVDHAPAWAALLLRGEDEFRRHVPDGLHPDPVAYARFMLPALRAALGLASS